MRVRLGHCLELVNAEKRHNFALPQQSVSMRGKTMATNRRRNEKQKQSLKKMHKKENPYQKNVILSLTSSCSENFGIRRFARNNERNEVINKTAR